MHRPAVVSGTRDVVVPHNATCRMPPAQSVNKFLSLGAEIVCCAQPDFPWHDSAVIAGSGSLPSLEWSSLHGASLEFTHSLPRNLRQCLFKLLTRTLAHSSRPPSGVAELYPRKYRPTIMSIRRPREEYCAPEIERFMRWAAGPSFRHCFWFWHFGRVLSAQERRANRRRLRRKTKMGPYRRSSQLPMPPRKGEYAKRCTRRILDRTLGTRSARLWRDTALSKTKQRCSINRQGHDPFLAVFRIIHVGASAAKLKLSTRCISELRWPTKRNRRGRRELRPRRCLSPGLPLGCVFNALKAAAQTAALPNAYRAG